MNDFKRPIITWTESPKKSAPLEMITKSVGTSEVVLRSLLEEFKEEILQQVCDQIDRIDARLSELAGRS